MQAQDRPLVQERVHDAQACGFASIIGSRFECETKYRDRLILQQPEGATNLLHEYFHPALIDRFHFLE